MLAPRLEEIVSPAGTGLGLWLLLAAWFPFQRGGMLFGMMECLGLLLRRLSISSPSIETLSDSGLGRRANRMEEHGIRK